MQHCNKKCVLVIHNTVPVTSVALLHRMNVTPPVSQPYMYTSQHFTKHEYRIFSNLIRTQI